MVNKFSELFSRIKKNDKALTSIDLYSSKIGDIEAAELAEALKKNTTLRSMGLSYTKIGDIGMKKLAKSLKVNTTLRSVVFGHTAISDISVEKLASVLKKNATLRSFTLLRSHTSITGVEKIAEALKENTTLVSIGIIGSYIGDAGAEKLSKILLENTTLTSIDLTKNNIGNVGAAQLAAALQLNTTVTSIGLSSNNVSDVSTIQLLGSLMKRNQNIQKETELSLAAVQKINSNDEMNKAGYDQYIIHAIKDIENNIEKLYELHPDPIRLMYIREELILKLMQPELRLDVKELMRSVSDDIIHNNTQYSLSVLELIILNYFGQKDKTKDDYENIMKLCCMHYFGQEKKIDHDEDFVTYCENITSDNHLIFIMKKSLECFKALKDAQVIADDETKCKFIKEKKDSRPFLKRFEELNIKKGKPVVSDSNDESLKKDIERKCRKH